jgi:hypothetical protein
MLQQVWAEMDYSLRSAMWPKADTHITYEVWKNLLSFSSICRSRVTILSGIQAYRLFEISGNYEYFCVYDM